MLYVARRLGNAVLVVWIAFTVTFFLVYLLPSDAVTLKLAQDAAGGAAAGIVSDPAVIAAARARYGFDQPLPVQYAVTGWRFLTGDLGVSIDTGVPVADSLAEALPQTALLAGTALVLAAVFGTALAVAAVAVTTPRWRNLLLALPPLGAAVPVFWLGLVLLQVFSFRAGWLPAMGNSGPSSLVLPAITLAVPTGAVYAQVLARSLLYTLKQPYIQVAFAKGLSRGAVLRRYALPNGALPTLTLVGITVGNLLAGAVITETVFSRVGIGRLVQAAVSAQDAPVVLAIVVVSAAAFAVTNLAVDLLYPVLDPRIRTSAAVPA